MLHRLTVGHLDPAAVERRQTVPTKALELNGQPGANIPPAARGR